MIRSNPKEDLKTRMNIEGGGVSYLGPNLGRAL